MPKPVRRIRRGKAEWSEMLSRFAASDMTVRESCRQERLPVSSFPRKLAGLLDGVESGTTSPLTKKDWAELRTQVAERLQKRRGGRGKKSR